MSFEVVVLGHSGTYPVPGSAASGYLLRSRGEDVWLDAGSGTFANLQMEADFLKLRAMVISHLHLDHILDLYPFYFAMRFWPTEPKGFQVYAPAGAEDLLTFAFSTSKEVEFRDFGGYLKFETIESGSGLDLGPFRFQFVRTVHPIETLAMRITSEGRTLVYTADTAPSEDVERLAQGADTLIAEATMLEPDPNLALVHMSATEAGEMAERAGVGKLVLTHVWPRNDVEAVAAKAKEAYSGEILVARDRLHIQV